MTPGGNRWPGNVRLPLRLPVVECAAAGFSAAGLVLRGVHAGFDDPLRVENIRCDSKSDSAVGIRIGPQDVGGTPDDCSLIVISGSRFDGPLAGRDRSAGKHAPIHFHSRVDLREYDDGDSLRRPRPVG